MAITPSGLFLRSAALVLTLSASLQTTTVQAAPGDPIGGDVQIVAGLGRQPAVAADGVGGYAVAYNCGTSICLQRNLADGSPDGTPIDVVDGVLPQTAPSLAMDASGNAVVVWRYAHEVLARRYDAVGTALGPAFLVAALPVEDDGGHNDTVQGLASVAMNPDGRFVVAWNSIPHTQALPLAGRDYLELDYGKILAQPYNADGSLPRGPITVDSSLGGNIPSYAYPIAAGIDGSGAFTIGWIDNIPSGAARFRRYAGTGSSLSVLAQTAVSGSAHDPYAIRVARSSGGPFTVAWNESASTNIYAQRYGADGKTIGSSFQVSSDAVAGLASIAIGSSGAELFTWSGQAAGSAGARIAARLYASDGMAQTAAFAVAEQSYWYDTYAGTPATAVLANGNYVIVWSAIPSDIYPGLSHDPGDPDNYFTHYRLYARRFSGH